MRMCTTFNGRRIQDSENNYGVGGAFPRIAPMLESEAENALAMHLFPDSDDSDAAKAGHDISAHCLKAREKEQGILPDDAYEVMVKVDGKEHIVTINLSW